MSDAPELIHPFPGLRPFEPDESYLFFGRDGQGDELLRRLRQSRFVAIVGTSGSGKSSLVRAGLIPALHGGLMTRVGSSWRIALFRPGNNPIGHLAAALNAGAILSAANPDVDQRTAMLDAVLRRSGVGLVEAIRQEGRPAHENLLVIVDQFEELFRFVREGNAADEDAAAFVKLILEARRQTEVPIYVALTMRSDFLGDCSRFRDLPEALNESQYLVPRMTRDQRREAIEGPVRVAGAEIAPRLLQRLLNDVGDNPDQLPILQHALMRTWEYWRRTAPVRSMLDLEHYVEIGTMAEALSRHADEAFDELDLSGASIAEKLFKRLTERGPDNREIRRPATLVEVCQVTSATLAEATAVVDRFRQPDRSFLMPPSDVELGAETSIDISHESLIRLWGRLRTWVNEEATSRDQYLRLIADADRHARNEVGLWQDPELQLALDWQNAAAPNAIWAERYDKRFDVAMAFLAASRQQRDEEAGRQARARAAKRRAAYAVALVSLLLAVVFAGLLIYARRQQAIAQEALVGVEQQRRAATSRQLASQARIEAGEGQLARALLLGVEAARVFPTSDARASLLTAFEHSRQLVAALQDPGGSPARVTFSPDGGTFASANPAGVSLWDTGSRRLLSRLQRKEEQGTPTDIAFRPDGKMVAASFDNDVALWDLEHGQSLRQLRATLPISALAFSPDGQTIAVGQRGDLITLWNARTGTKDADLRVTARNYLISLAFQSGGTRLAAGYEDGAVALWDMPTRTRTRLVENRALGPIRTLVFRSGGELLLGTGSGKILVLDPDTGSAAASFGDDDSVETMALSADGNLLAVGHPRTDRPLTLWDLSSGKRQETPLRGHLSKVTGVSFSADGRYLASVGVDSELMLWDVRSGAQPLATALPSANVHMHQLVVSPDGSTAAAVTQDRTSNVFEVLIWNLREQKPVVRIATPAAVRDSLAFSADSTGLVVLGCSDQQDAPPSICNQLKVTAWDARSGRSAADPVLLPVSAHTYALAAHGTSVVVATCTEPSKCPDSTIDVWDLRRRPLRSRVLLTGSENPDRFISSPDGGRLVMCAGKRSVMWELSTGVMLGPAFECSRAAFSGGGKLLATAQGEFIQIRDAANGRPLSRPLAAGTETVNSLTFAPDGRELVSDTFRKSGDEMSQAFVFWDLQNPASPEQGYLLRTGTTSSVEHLAYSSDGRMLLSASWNDGAFAWDVSQRSWNERACGIAGRNLTQEEWQRAFGSQPYRLTCHALPVHPTVLDAATSLAGEGDVDAAAVILRRIAELDPAHAPDIAALLKEHGVPGLLKQAEYLVASGDSAGAAAALRRAEQLDPTIDTSSVLREQGERLAREGNVEGAVRVFRYARSRNPALRLNPESEARRLAAPEVLKQAERLAQDHRLAEALAAFERVREYDPTLEIYPTAWHALCRAGLAVNQPARVKDACNNAIKAGGENDQYLESRGIMRALAGDTEGALADLRKSVALLLEEEPGLAKQRGGAGMAKRNRDLRDRCQTWIDALSRGEQPFTAEVLAALDR